MSEKLEENPLSMASAEFIRNRQYAMRLELQGFGVKEIPDFFEQVSP